MNVPAFISSAELRTRLTRYARITVPIESGSPLVDGLDPYTDEVNAMILDYLGHRRVVTTFDGGDENEPVVKVRIDKSGQGKIPFCHPTLFPLTEVTELTIPESASWTSVGYTLDDLAWDSGGAVQFIPVPETQINTGWISPVPAMRRFDASYMSGPLPAFPNEIELAIVAGVGTVDDLPEIFKSVATELAVIRLLKEDQADLILRERIDQTVAGDRTVVVTRKNAEDNVLSKLRGYSLQFYG